jgi:MFS family permease
MEATVASGRPLSALLVVLAVVSTAVASLGAPLLPTVAAVDHVSLATSQWTLTISLLAGAVATPLLGRLGDGRRRRAVTMATVAAVLAGCLLSALPFGFAVLLAGRALQGAGLALVPLATATARDSLPAGRSRRTIVLVGITTAAGIGLGYPLAGLLAQYLGLGAAFAAGALLAAIGLAAAAALLPASPNRDASVDLRGAALLGLGVTGLLLAVAQGPVWGWRSVPILALGLAALAVLGTWAGHELHTSGPLVQLRLLGHHRVLAANLTGLLVALGFYPLMSLVVRYVQTPPATGYGLGASALVAGLMLTPFSLASFAAQKPATRLARRTSAEWVIAASCIILIAGQAIFLTSRAGYLPIVAAMTLTGFGVGCVFAVNPIQIVSGVPAGETGSAMSFYQLTRTTGYSLASALSASILVAYIPHGQAIPANAGYTAAALIGIAVLAAAFATSVAFASARQPQRAAQPRAGPTNTIASGDRESRRHHDTDEGGNR